MVCTMFLGSSAAGHLQGGAGGGKEGKPPPALAWDASLGIWIQRQRPERPPWALLRLSLSFFTLSGIFSNRHIHQVHVDATLQPINAFGLVIGFFSFFIDLESSGRISSQVQQQCIYLHRHKPACLFSFSYLRLSSKHPQIPAEFWIIWLYRSLYG